MPTESPRSTLMFSAQTRSYGLKVSENTDNSSTPTKSNFSLPEQKAPSETVCCQRVYTILPKYNTPVRKPMRNPFNERLIEIFNAPTCSPDFSIHTVSPQVEQSDDFFWKPEDLWRIDPAPIESPQTDVEDNIDEETESLAQEAIERYFQESHNILSPIGSPKPVVLLKRGGTPDAGTPVADRARSTPCTRFESRRILKSTVAVQTLLSFCSDIPESLLEALKPYVNSLESSHCETSLSSSSSNLRRKLLFHQLDESSDSDPDTKLTNRFSPSDWTPDKVKSTLELFSKSPEISPIGDGLAAPNNKTDYFNFTREMAIDCTTSPIKGEKCGEDGRRMSEFADSMMDCSTVERRISVDTGYQTNSLERSDKCGVAPVTEIQDTELGRSYVGVANASSGDTGITSTPHKCKINLL